jgi:DNA (cytosine-5)-methyltransferase 1
VAELIDLVVDRYKQSTARIQEFPAGWEFVGSPQEQMTQVGNAVPVRLGEIAGEVIRSSLTAGKQEPDPEAPAFRRVYVESHVRTRQWWRNGKAFVWDGIDGTAHYGASRKTP